MGLYIVRDAEGRQWLCPSRPILVGRGDDPNRHWEVKWEHAGADETLPVSWPESRCIMLSKEDGLDADCFEGSGAWKVYGVGVALA